LGVWVVRPDEARRRGAPAAEDYGHQPAIGRLRVALLRQEVGVHPLARLAHHDVERARDAALLRVPAEEHRGVDRYLPRDGLRARPGGAIAGAHLQQRVAGPVVEPEVQPQVIAIAGDLAALTAHRLTLPRRA